MLDEGERLMLWLASAGEWFSWLLTPLSPHLPSTHFSPTLLLLTALNLSNLITSSPTVQYGMTNPSPASSLSLTVSNTWKKYIWRKIQAKNPTIFLHECLGFLSPFVANDLQNYRPLKFTFKFKSLYSFSSQHNQKQCTLQCISFITQIYVHTV